MEFIAFPPSEWSAFGQLNEATVGLDEKCFQIIGKLKEAFEQDSLIGSNACSITVASGSREFASIKTPFGRGRIVRSWSISGRELQGLLNFQREQFDKYERSYWETIWKITVPRYDDAYSGTGESSLRLDLHGFSSNPRNVAFAIAMSVLAGFVNGPAQIIAHE